MSRPRAPKKGAFSKGAPGRDAEAAEDNTGKIKVKVEVEGKQGEPVEKKNNIDEHQHGHDLTQKKPKVLGEQFAKTIATHKFHANPALNQGPASL